MVSICTVIILVLFVGIDIGHGADGYFGNDGIKKMAIKGVEQIFRDNQKKGTRHAIFDYLQSIEDTKLLSVVNLGHSFKWKKCDDSPALLDVTDFNISPDPIHFPGNVYLHFGGTLKESIDAPLQLNVTMKKKITSSFWLEIPCFNGIGSCSYNDLCEMLQGATCPIPFVKYDIPCKCPFSKGTYKLEKSVFHVKLEDIPVGLYSIRTKTSYKEKLVSCIDVYFNIQQA